jgi:SWI/SNF-related matrix-associated actin-dependent regulator of chromatin subfamily D
MFFGSCARLTLCCFAQTEVRETLRVGDKAPRTVRLYVWNTVTPPASPGEPAAWTLHIHGKLLDAAPAAGAAHGAIAAASAATSSVRVVSLFRSVEVKLDESLYPGPEGVVTWQRDAAGASGLQADGWEVKRPVRGSCGVATVTLCCAHAPARNALPPQLARLLGTAAASRTAAVHALWARCRALGALGAEDPSEVRVDPLLAEALSLPASAPGQSHTVKFAQLAERLVAQLAPPAPFTIRLPLRADAGPRGAGADVYDVTVDLPDPRAAEMTALVARHAKDQAAAEYDARIAVQLAKIAEHRRRRAFLLGFAAAPAPFLNALNAAQARELEITAGGAVKAREAERRADFYRLPWTDDAIMHYLQRRAGANLS